MAESSGNLGELIRLRRLELGLSVSRAARLADVDRGSWTDWEKGRKPFESNYVNIERALQWPPRFISGVMAPRAHEHSPPAAPPIPPDVTVDPALWAAMTPQDRTDYVRIVTGARRRLDRQRRDGASRTA